MVATNPAPATASSGTPLLRQRDFLRLWGAETLALLGAQVSYLALPLTAVAVLDASPLQMGLLTALSSLPGLVLGLFAGVWVDRRRRRPLLIASDLARAVLLLTIPLAALLGVLRLELLYAVAVLTGALSLLFTIAYRAYLPTLIAREELLEGNSRLEMSRSGAELVGPALGGGLVHLLSAPLALLANAATYLGSAVLLRGIRTPEVLPQPEATAHSLWRQMHAGLHLVATHPILRRLVACTAMLNLCNSVIDVAFLLYVTRTLGLSPLMLGLIFATGSVGFLVGALLPNRLQRRVGTARTLVLALLLVGLSDLFVPLVGGIHGWALFALLALTQAGFGIGLTLYSVTQNTLQQLTTPNHLRGRMQATVQVILGGVVPLGALLGGLLGAWIGLRATLVLAATGEMLSLLWLLGLNTATLDGAAVTDDL